MRPNEIASKSERGGEDPKLIRLVKMLPRRTKGGAYLVGFLSRRFFILLCFFPLGRLELGGDLVKLAVEGGVVDIGEV